MTSFQGNSECSIIFSGVVLEEQMVKDKFKSRENASASIKGNQLPAGKICRPFVFSVNCNVIPWNSSAAIINTLVIIRFFSVWIATHNEGMLAAFEGPSQLKGREGGGCRENGKREREGTK